MEEGDVETTPLAGEPTTEQHGTATTGQHWTGEAEAEVAPATATPSEGPGPDAGRKLRSGGGRRVEESARGRGRRGRGRGRGGAGRTAGTGGGRVVNDEEYDCPVGGERTSSVSPSKSPVSGGATVLRGTGSGEGRGRGSGGGKENALGARVPMLPAPATMRPLGRSKVDGASEHVRSPQLPYPLNVLHPEKVRELINLRL